MKLYLFFAFTLIFHSAQSQFEPPRESFQKNSSKEFFLGGIHINEPDLDYWVNTIKDVGMNTVEVTAYAKQWNWDSGDLDFEQDLKQESELRLAKEAGLKAVFIARVQLQHWYENNHFKWHGMIMPSTDSLIIEWFDNYIAFNLMWANICEELGVDVMVIGSEMNALSSTVPIDKMPDLYEYYENVPRQYRNENRIYKYKEKLEEKYLRVKGKDNYTSVSAYINDKITNHHNWSEQVTYRHQPDRIGKMNARRKLITKQWLRLIKEVRKIYSGKLTYAANFDNYQEVEFWNALDFVGINAYFPLREPKESLPNPNELYKQFRKSWYNIFSDILQFQQLKNIDDKPIFFTELGYTRNSNSTVASWEGQGFSIVGHDKNEQLIIWEEQPEYSFERYLAIRALQVVCKKHSVNLNGLLYWKLTTQEYLLREEPFGMHIYKGNKSYLQNALLNILEQAN